MNHLDNRSSLSPRPWSRLTTFAWSLLAVSLLAALLFVRQAEAFAVTTPAQAPVTVTSSVEDEEVEGEESEGEEGEEEESEDEEEDEGLGTVGPLLLPPECLLHTAEAHVSASASHGMVRLTIRYTSYAPTDASVDYWLKGSKGALHLGETKRHFGRQGVLREETHVSDRAMAKVLAARAFIVQLDIAGAPSFCDQYSTQRLTVKHVAGNHATWSRPR
jgi:ribosomal protein L12E/L44/L45/RPP1/RPP2